MQRIVVVGSGAASAKVAARVKRLAPEVEVNWIIPEVETGKGDGPFARLSASRRVSSALIEARQVGIIPAEEVELDFTGKQVTVHAPRGMLQIRFNQLVLEVGAEPRIPRTLRAADNVVPWPVDEGAALDAWLAERAPEKVVVVGGRHAAALLAPLQDSGFAVTWLRTSDDGLDADMWRVWARRVTECAHGSVEIVDWSAACGVAGADALSAVLSEDGSLKGLQGGGENAGMVEGDVFFWTDPLRALHPVIAEEGVELDAQGCIAVDAQFRTGVEGLYIIGSGVAVPRSEIAGHPAPGMGASEDAAVLASARVVASSLADSAGIAVLQADGGAETVGLRQMEASGLVAVSAGLTAEEASRAGHEPEFSLLSAVPHGIKGEDSPIALKLLCDKASHLVLGIQAVGTAGNGWLESAINPVVAALSAGGNLTVDRLATLQLAGGGAELLRRAASMLSNKLLNRFYGISADELLASREAGASFFILDLRDSVAWRAGHIEDAYNIPYPQLKKRLQDEVPRFTPIVLVGRGSDDAFSAACQLYGLGATELYVLDGGMALWPHEVVKG